MRLITMPKATPISTKPIKSWMGASGLPNTMTAARSRPISTPFIAPERAAAAYPSLPVTRSIVRTPLPTIVMSRAGTSPAMSFETVRCALSYSRAVATTSPVSSLPAGRFSMLIPPFSHVRLCAGASLDV